MSVLIIAPHRDMTDWKEAIHLADPSIEIEVFPGLKHPEKVKAAVLWNHPHGVLRNFPNLKWVTSLGAGVDHILNDHELPEGVRVVRIVDPGIAVQMSRMVITMLTVFEKDVIPHLENKKSGKWKPSHKIKNLKIGLLGLGEIGKKVADSLKCLNYEVACYRMSGKGYNNLKVFGPEKLGEFLKSVDVVVCLLPLTSKTIGFINDDFFSWMKQESFFMNLARGKILDEMALLRALDSGILKKAYLDVFETEPLPGEHPFWKHEKVIITPHISGISDAALGVKQIVNNYHTFEKNQTLLNEIDKTKEY